MLAAMVVVYSVGLIQPAEFRDIARVRTTEFYWAVIAFAGVALLGKLKLAATFSTHERTRANSSIAT